MDKNLNQNYIDSKCPFAIIKLSNLLYERLTPVIESGREIVVLCIGTDRSTGDSLGPLVGYKLEPFIDKYTSTYLMGTLEKPVHAKNLSDTIKHIENYHPQAFTIAVDASLGSINSIGQIILKEGPLKPGLGVRKNLPPVGDISITGVVNMGGMMEYMVLQNTRLSLVMNMAKVIARGVNISLRYLYNYRDEKSINK